LEQLQRLGGVVLGDLLVQLLGCVGCGGLLLRFLLFLGCGLDIVFEALRDRHVAAFVLSFEGEVLFQLR
jgi:hypothetical protein